MVYEIAMIKQMKYAGYFLIVWDFIRFARESGIPVGSIEDLAHGSTVATTRCWRGRASAPPS
ncbi:MAG: hypothetical protein HC787_02055 [Nostocaceae cyanobacterium CSU_2_110]|nr:hypothetical protein [Nostocaceae cyanobacterium CSU_2_110]